MSERKKLCTICKEKKSLTDFVVDRNRACGRRCACKACESKIRKAKLAHKNISVMAVKSHPVLDSFLRGAA